MNKFLENFIFKVGDILVDPENQIVEEEREIQAWDFSGLDDFKLSASVQVKSKLQKIAKGEILGIFEIITQLKGKCFRCLESTKKKLEFKTEAVFSIYDTEEAEFKISKYGEINIQSLLEQEIITHLPQNFLCKKDCRGLCLGCGVNLNKEKCKCKNSK